MTRLAAEFSFISLTILRRVSSAKPSSSQKTGVPANSGTALAILIMASVWLTMEGIAGFLKLATMSRWSSVSTSGDVSRAAHTAMRAIDCSASRFPSFRSSASMMRGSFAA